MVLAASSLRRLATVAAACAFLALTTAGDCGKGVSTFLNTGGKGGSGGGGGLDCSDSQNVVTCPSFTNCPNGNSDCSKMNRPCNGTPVTYLCVDGQNGPYCCPSAGAPCNHSTDCCPGLACNMHVCTTQTCPMTNDSLCHKWAQHVIDLANSAGCAGSGQDVNVFEQKCSDYIAKYIDPNGCRSTYEAYLNCTLTATTCDPCRPQYCANNSCLCKATNNDPQLCLQNCF